MLFFKKRNKQQNMTIDKIINTPVEGDVVPIEQVPDDVFAKKMMGDGFAVQPQNGDIYAPISGKISFIADTKHGIGITTDNGMELIIHLGIDTVSLNGKPFDIKVTEGQHINKDQKVGHMDIPMIKNASLNPIVIVAFTNLNDNFKIKSKNYGNGMIGFDAVDMV